MGNIITLDEIKTDHAALGAKIDKFEAQQQPLKFKLHGFEITHAGSEVYIGTIITPDSAYHLFDTGLEFKGKHAECMKWAEENGGELMDRVEGALLFQAKKAGKVKFDDVYYWTRELYASDSDRAWVQTLGGGGQYAGYVDDACRARLVRRSFI